MITYEKLWALFKHFDTDDSGTITPANLKDAFANAGKKLTDEDLKKIMAEHDIEKNNVLSFDEFKLLFENEAGDTSFTGLHRHSSSSLKL